MKAFWTIVPAVNIHGTWRPDLPELETVSYVNPLDINRLLPNAGEGVNHTHLIAGGLAMASDSDGANGLHEHFVIYYGGSWFVKVRNGAEHAHLGNQQPDYFMCFVTCSDADFTTLTGASNNVPVICQAVIDSEGNIGALVNTAWTAGQRNTWANAALNTLGVTLPVEVDRGNRLVAFLGGMLQARRLVDERAIR